MSSWLAGLLAVLFALVAPAAPGSGAGAPARYSRSSASASASASSTPGSGQATLPAAVLAAATSSKPLAGVVIALDPGHQLGNRTHLAQIDRPVTAGTHGFRKACNTTGTATDGGYPEATLNWRIVTIMRKDLERLGATVRLTRTSNSLAKWGPCIDTRGRFGGKVHARLLVSVHGDGAAPGDHGFFTIAPSKRRMFHPGVQKRSVRLAKDLRRGMDAHHVARSNYIGNGTAFYTRDDLGTLNCSSVPVALVEVGNMRNAHDAKVMTTVKGRRRYAAGLVAGIRDYLAR
jgi:N-acetylmuramoyl-L-alanine amidase